ncbi:MAG TPA: hypothetical protein VEJ87_02815, partial [Acidimicrobiales bacterium]|nr:hypothetical protein [Acidimicrobiales bacterium]
MTVATRRRALRSVVLVFGLALASPTSFMQVSGPAEAAEASPLISHAISTTAFDPSAAGPSALNLAMVGLRASWNGQLVVFLPGSGGKPSCCTMFLSEAATLGFHAIGLTYDNSTSVGGRCLNDLSCYATVRQNVFDGMDPSALSSLSPLDGVEHRLVTLLEYLAQRFPAEGWNRFVSGGQPVYRLIVLTGHSQGGGEAAFIATERTVSGVVTLSSPPDTNNLHQAAPWLATVSTGKTPLDRYYAFVHLGDPFYPRITADWTSMGL